MIQKLSVDLDADGSPSTYGVKTKSSDWIGGGASADEVLVPVEVGGVDNVQA
jgi:hypothetical protein